MLNWLRSKFVLQIIKALLDKLPADGKKTWLGLILLIVGAAAEFFQGQFPGEILQAIADLIKGMNYEDVAGTGLGIVIVGLVHKVLKWIFGESEK